MPERALLSAADLADALGDGGEKLSLPDKAGAVIVAASGADTQTLIFGQGIDARTLMEAGSVSKAFTGLVLADALLRRELTLDARVDEVLFGERWSDVGVTVRHLATHTSGLPRLSVSPYGGLLGDPYRDLGREHVLDWLREHKPAPAAAPEFAYSNFGYAVLGLVLEQALGKPYPELLCERVLLPLGLEHTFLQLTGGPTLVEPGYSILGRHAKPWHHQSYAPAGGLVTTARDLIQALQQLADPNGPLASAAALAAEPLAPVPNGHVGLAWMLPPSGNAAWHNGGTFGYSAYASFSRKHGVAVAMLENCMKAQELTGAGHKLMVALANNACAMRTSSL